MSNVSKAPQVQTVSLPVIPCDGGEAQLGHPRIYLNVSADHDTTCPYCSQQFRLAAGVKVGPGH